LGPWLSPSWKSIPVSIASPPKAEGISLTFGEVIWKDGSVPVLNPYVFHGPKEPTPESTCATTIANSEVRANQYSGKEEVEGLPKERSEK